MIFVSYDVLYMNVCCLLLSGLGLYYFEIACNKKNKSDWYEAVEISFYVSIGILKVVFIAVYE